MQIICRKRREEADDEACNGARIRTFDELWAWSEDARIPSIMPFGQFQGQPISAVDKGYRAWYHRQPDPDPYILMAFARYKA